MLAKQSDVHWEAFGQQDPYFGVLVCDEYKSDNLTDQSKAEFFASGAEYVDNMFRTIEKHIDSDFTPHSALDFGCGVGRLTIPMAERCQRATGVDISESMLQEAARNCQAKQLQNVSLQKSDDRLTAASGPFDLVHSFIVLQHIRARRGTKIIQQMFDRLSPGGVGVLHVTYDKDSASKKLLGFLKSRVPLARNLINVVRGRKWSYPAMQMNDYNLNRLFSFFQAHGVQSIHTEFTDHGGYRGVVMYFKKPLCEQADELMRVA